MNFTREPIIETIISPKEGYKLLVKCSKGGSSEEYSVDAVEVVSFGQSFFFRSLERPKSFLVPVSDYEIIEVKEMRVVLKSPSVEKAIKIGGGKVATAEAGEQRTEKKRERRRHRRRRGSETEEVQVSPELPPTPLAETPIKPSGALTEPAVVAKEEAPPAVTRLIPPPTKLISETLVKVRDAMIEATEEPPAEKEKEKPKAKAVRKGRKSAKKATKEPEGGEAGDAKRVATEVEEPMLTATTFSAADSDFYPPFGSDLF
ncbi:MAG: hypothetical protein K940chlam2_00628 [Chlamydiae bacterium]|nr:hypothetical protein [Chlamydiota bacterium]